MPEHRNALHYAVLLFAGIRERVGAPTIEVSVQPGATVKDLLDALARVRPDLADHLEVCRVAVDQELVVAGHRLGGGEEVAVIPPVSGGTDLARYRLTEDPLSLAEVVDAVAHAGAGAIATFTGNVRDHSRGKTIRHLEYEAYGSMALKRMQQIGAEIESATEGARVAIFHRVGRLEIGETAVVIACSAPHRAEAFAGCREAIEQLKRSVPIWKREVAADGVEWVEQGP